MKFYLGVDATFLWRSEPAWLAAVEDAEVELMVSHGRLRRYKTLRPAVADWVCDSRGFTELSQHGRWTITPEEYAEALIRYADEIGRLRWASPQDWMCEDVMLAKTGKTVAEHQDLTVTSVIRLRELVAGRVHIIPVLQGQTVEQYVECVEKYRAAGIDLTAEPVVGLGSVCRRQASREIRELVEVLSAMGIRLHGFGVKTEAMEQYGPLLESADSFAWSKANRHRAEECVHGVVAWERNCPVAALTWRDQVVAKLSSSRPEPAGDYPVADRIMTETPKRVTVDFDEVDQIRPATAPNQTLRRACELRDRGPGRKGEDRRRSPSGRHRERPDPGEDRPGRAGPGVVHRALRADGVGRPALAMGADRGDLPRR